MASRFVQFLITLALLAGLLLAQQGKKAAAHSLTGKVEAVNAASNSLTVNHGKVEGWMDAMTMAYKVYKPELLKGIKAGDQIKATVYDGDYKLHDVAVVTQQKK